MTVTRSKEQRTVDYSVKSVVVDETVLMDFGREGTTTCYIVRKETDSKMREDTMRRIQEVSRQLMQSDSLYV